MKIFLAGANGYIGNRLCNELIQHGHSVIAADIRFSPLDNPNFNGADKLIINACNPESLKNTMMGCDLLISCIGLEKPSKTLSYWDIDFKGNKNLLEAAKEQMVKKFVYISVIHADLNAKSELVRAKASFEKELIESGLEYCIYRPTGYFKDIVNLFYKKALTGKILLIGNGTHKMNALHPDEFAQYICQSCIDLKGIHEIGGCEILTYNDLASFCFSLVGKKEQITHVPILIFKCLILFLKLKNKELVPIMDFSLWTMNQDLVAKEIGKTGIKEYLINEYNTMVNQNE